MYVICHGSANQRAKRVLPAIERLEKRTNRDRDGLKLRKFWNLYSILLLVIGLVTHWIMNRFITAGLSKSFSLVISSWLTFFLVKTVLLLILSLSRLLAYTLACMIDVRLLYAQKHCRFLTVVWRLSRVLVLFGLWNLLLSPPSLLSTVYYFWFALFLFYAPNSATKCFTETIFYSLTLAVYKTDLRDAVNQT